MNAPAPVLTPARSKPRVVYEPPDLVLEAFHEDKARVRGVMGPRGSGKSGASIAEAVQGAFGQNVNPRGYRRSRFLVLRDTYRQLETTTIPSFKKWLGHATRFTGQYPIRGFTKLPCPDGTRIEMETIFLAMDGENIIDNLQSFEASFAWINEARGIERPDVVSMVQSSCGRYPSKDEEGCATKFVVMDTNPPDEYHWWYKADVETPVEGWKFFRQVPPLLYDGPPGTYVGDKRFYRPNPAATYARIQNAGYDYWLDLIPGSSDAFIRTMVMGQYGTLVTGKPVYESFWHEDVISAEPLRIHDALTVCVGIDTSGLHPGAVFGQIAGGRVNLLRELHAKDTPFDEFIEAVFAPFVAQHFPRCPLICIVDPSNPRLGAGGKTALQLLQRRGFEATLATSNRFNLRVGAVVYLLQRRGALAIDPSLKMVIEGFRGKYHYKKIESSGLMVMHRQMPEKNDFADVHDGLQYLALHYQQGRMPVPMPMPKQKVLWA